MPPAPRKPRCDFYSDTDPAALEVFLDLQRKMSGGEKLAMVFDSINRHHAQLESEMRREYPNASDHEILMRVASLRLDCETMIRAYGWDPDEHAQ